MRKVITLALLTGVVFSAIVLFSQAKETPVVTMPLDSLRGIEVVDGKGEIADYRGRRALHLLPPEHPSDDASMLGVVTGSDFHDGTIELEVAGTPRAGAPEDSRGFIGLVFRAQDHGARDRAAREEIVYLRPTNGRAADQLRRNHSAQYESSPDFPWHRLRKESPGVYESYVDLDAGAWTKMKIVVSGTKARLYVNGAEQPCLIVNDLKLGDTHGMVALWAHSTTDAYFSNLRIGTAK